MCVLLTELERYQHSITRLGYTEEELAELCYGLVMNVSDPPETCYEIIMRVGR